jgi:hypothetical protein
MSCFFYYLLWFFLLQNQRAGGQNRFCPEGQWVWHLWKGEVARERGRRMNKVQIMYTHVCKFKNKTVPGIGGEGMKESRGVVNSSMIYMIHCKSLCKCCNVHSPSKTIIKKMYMLLVY